jgi:hypothetical protein
MQSQARSYLALAAAAFAASVSLAASADMLHPNGFIFSPAQTFQVHRDATAQTVNVGGFTGTFGSPAEDIIFWCFDLDHTFSFGNNYDYTEQAFANATVEHTLSQLFEEAYAHATTDGATASAAFQLAVWNIAYDTDTSVSPPGSSSNHFWATNPSPSGSTARELANSWLADLGNYSGDGWNVTQLISTPDRSGNHHQNFITATYTPPQRDLPEPPALPLALAALAGLALTRQFRGNRARGG